MAVRPVVVALGAAATVFVSGCVPDSPSRLGGGGTDRADPEALPFRVTDADCRTIHDRAVEERGRRGSSILAAPDGVGRSPAVIEALTTVRTPVGDIGDWVIRTPTDGVVLVEDGRAATLCGPTGAPRRASGPVSSVGGLALTDADLRRAVGRHPGGLVVYVWSPHMPLSVDGYAPLREAAEARGLVVLPALFAGSDAGFAQREAERAAMPDSALRFLAATELILRDAQVHAPSVVVFQGVEASPVMPGYRNAEGYGRWLDAVLSAPGARLGTSR